MTRILLPFRTYCPDCKGTGLFVGFFEQHVHTSVICGSCRGSGATNSINTYFIRGRNYGTFKAPVDPKSTGKVVIPLPFDILCTDCHGDIGKKKCPTCKGSTEISSLTVEVFEHRRNPPDGVQWVYASGYDNARPEGRVSIGVWLDGIMPKLVGVDD